MDEALDHDELVRQRPLDVRDEPQQMILEASERSAFRPSRRDTNSPEEFKPAARGITQDVRGHTRAGLVQGYPNFQQGLRGIGWIPVMDILRAMAS